MNSPFRRGLCTGSSFQQMLRRRMREVSPFAQHRASPLALTCPHPHATLAPGATNHRASGRIRKRGGGAGGPGAAQGRGRVPTKAQGGAAAPDGRPPAAAVRGVQLPLAALHDGPLPQSQRLPAREVRAPRCPPALPRGAVGPRAHRLRSRSPACRRSHAPSRCAPSRCAPAPSGVRPLPSSRHPARPVSHGLQ